MAGGRYVRPMSAVNTSGFVAPGWEAVRAAFEQNLSSGEDVGAGATIYHRGQLVVDVTGGWFDEEHSRPYDADVLQLVFSTTKGITAIAVAICVQRLARVRPAGEPLLARVRCAGQGRRHGGAVAQSPVRAVQRGRPGHARGARLAHHHRAPCRHEARLAHRHSARLSRSHLRVPRRRTGPPCRPGAPQHREVRARRGCRAHRGRVLHRPTGGARAASVATRGPDGRRAEPRPRGAADDRHVPRAGEPGRARSA